MGIKVSDDIDSFFCPQGFSTPHTRLVGHTQQHGQPSLARFCFRCTRTTHIRQEQKQRRKRVSQNHGSAVHRASQRTAPAIAARCIGQRSALRLTHVPSSMPAATSSTKKPALLHHTHENTPEMHLLHLPTPTKTPQKTPIQPAYTQKEHSQATFCPPTPLGQITPASLASEKNQKHTATHVPSGCRTAHKGKQKDILCNVFTKSCHKVLQKHKNVLPLHTQYGDKACQARQDTPGSTLDA